MALPLMLGICLVSGVALYFTSKATKATSSYSHLSGDLEGTEYLSSPEAFDSGPSVDAAEGENSVDTMTVEKPTEFNIPSPAALDVVHAAEGSDSEATEADATPVEVDPMAVGNILAAECNTPSTGQDDVVNASVVDGDSSAGHGCNVLEVAKVDSIKVGEGGGGTGSRANVEPPGLWEAAKRALMWAKAKLKSGAEWLWEAAKRALMWAKSKLKSGAEWVMLDPAVVRRISKRMIWVAVDDVVNRAFMGNTVAFKFCRILISELKCSM